MLGYIALSRLQLAEGDFASAEDNFQKAEQMVRETSIDPWTVTRTDECRLILWLETGNLSSLRHWISQAGLSVDDELTFHRDLEHLNLARALVGLGSCDPIGPQLREALHLLERILSTATEAGWLGKSITCLNLQSLAYQALDHEAQALEQLERALRLAESGNYMRIFLDEGQPMAKLLYQALASGITVGYTGKLVSAFDELSPQQKAFQVEELIEPLTKREIEVLELIAQGLTNREIGSALSISLGTVKRHTANINGKLGVNNRTQAVARSRTLGIL